MGTEWIKKILFLTAITGFFISAYFLNFMSWANEIITWFNENFFSKIPFEIQIFVYWFISVIIIWFITLFTRD